MPFRPSHPQSIPRTLLLAAVSIAPVISRAWGASAPDGRAIFESKPCAACHSIGGKGGSVGPALDGIGGKRDSESLRKKIATPRFDSPSTIMPSVALSPAELDALVGYLSTLKSGHPAIVDVPKSDPKTSIPTGDSNAGRSVFDAKGCGGCHSLKGAGGSAGPALDEVGALRDAAWIRVQITNPKAHKPNSIMPATPMTPAELTALVSFLSAQKSSGPPPSSKIPPTGPARFVGSAACLPCHRDLAAEFRKTVHADALLDAHGPDGMTGCESCHGPGSLHAATGDPKLIVQPAKLTPRHTSELCLRCHTGQVTTHEWLTSAHSQAGISCSSCHQVMKQVVSKLLKKPADDLCVSCHRKEAAQFAGVSHHPVPEGRMHCVDCHNPHSGINERMLRLPGNDLCLSCHADKQGPFVFEHPAVSGGFTEGCLSCHSPHGSPFMELRKISGRGLCLQCHTDKAIHHFDTYPDCTTSGCHVKIHGSHEDQLFLR